MSSEEKSRASAPDSQTEEDGLRQRTEQPGRPGHWRRLKWWLGERHEIVKDYAQVVAILIAAGWGVYVFVYENIWKPSKEVPDVITSATLEQGGRGNKLIAVKASAVARNVGKKSAHILGAWFNVEGVKVSERDGAQVGPYKENVKSQIKREGPGRRAIDMHASRYSDYDQSNEAGRS
jgi:hypothetical protein